MGHRWRRAALALGMVVALVSAPSAAGAQSEPSGDPLVDSLLTAEDLPAGVESQGIDEPPRFDIDQDSFGGHEGTRAVGQVWAQTETPPLLVFDHRMQLPDAEAAAAYLEDAEAILSEAAASGLAPVMLTEPIGEDGRYYFGVQQVGDVELQMHNFLFHVGPVAAKVFIAGQDLGQEMPSGIATLAAERMAASLESAAGASTGPGASASPGASAEASAGPETSASPGASAGPDASLPAGPVGELLAHVPPSVRETCHEIDTQGSEIAVVSCEPAVGPAVLYALYGNGIAVDGDFTMITDGLPAERAATCAEGPYLGVFEVDAEVVGQLACWMSESGANVLASDKRIPMIVFLLSDDLDLAALEQSLNDLAPIP